MYIHSDIDAAGFMLILILLQVAGLVTDFLVPMLELYYAASMLVLMVLGLICRLLCKNEEFHSCFKDEPNAGKS